MIDLVFPKGNEDAFLSISSKLGMELLFASEHKGSDIGIFPKVTKAKLLITKVNESLRQQLECPADCFFGIELLTEIDQVALSLLAKKNKFVVFFLRHLLEENMVFPLERMQVLVPLFRKYKVQIALASGANNPYQLRSAHDMESLGMLIGMTPQEAKQSLVIFKERLLHANKRQKGEILSSGIIVQQ